MIHQTNLIPADALTVNQSIILIKPSRAHDKALIAHEKVHQAQMARFGTWTFWWRYLTNKQFRQQMEVEAYRTQIIFGASLIGCATLLSQNYFLNITLLDAMKLLKEE